jgi:hypothetical protein
MGLVVLLLTAILITLLHAWSTLFGIGGWLLAGLAAYRLVTWLWTLPKGLWSLLQWAAEQTS